MTQAYPTARYLAGDFDGNGVVNASDMAGFIGSLQHAGVPAEYIALVPEPATFAMAAYGHVGPRRGCEASTLVMMPDSWHEYIAATPREQRTFCWAFIRFLLSEKTTEFMRRYCARKLMRLMTRAGWCG